MRKTFLLAAAVALAMLTGCVATDTPEGEQSWYEYQPGYMRDGYDGNKPWYFYPVVVPAYVIVSLFVR